MSMTSFQSRGNNAVQMNLICITYEKTMVQSNEVNQLLHNRVLVCTVVTCDKFKQSRKIVNSHIMTNMTDAVGPYSIYEGILTYIH